MGSNTRREDETEHGEFPHVRCSIPVVISYWATVLEPEEEDGPFVAVLPLLYNEGLFRTSRSRLSALLDIFLGYGVHAQRLVSLHSNFSVGGHKQAKWDPERVVVRIPLPRDIPPGAYTIVATILDTFPGLSTDDALLSKRSLSWHYTHSRPLANSSIPEPHTKEQHAAKDPGRRSSCQHLRLLFEVPPSGSIVRVGSSVRVEVFVPFASLPEGHRVQGGAGSLSLSLRDALEEMSTTGSVQGQWVPDASGLRWRSLPLVLESSQMVLFQAHLELPMVVGTSATGAPAPTSLMCGGYAEMKVQVSGDRISIKAVSMRPLLSSPSPPPQPTLPSSTPPWPVDSPVEVQVRFHAQIPCPAAAERDSCITPLVTLKIADLTVNHTSLLPVCTCLGAVHQSGVLAYSHHDAHGPLLLEGTRVRILLRTHGNHREGNVVGSEDLEGDDLEDILRESVHETRISLTGSGPGVASKFADTEQSVEGWAGLGSGREHGGGGVEGVGGAGWVRVGHTAVDRFSSMQCTGGSQPQWHPSFLLHGVVSARPSLCVFCVRQCVSVASVASPHPPQRSRVCNCISACVFVSVSVSVSVSHSLNQRHADH